jgi:ABC-type sugar transport system substrate-binding protein
MADTIGLTDAARALEEQFGTRLDVNQEDGRQQMAEALSARFGLTDGEANQLVVALEAAHTIRWIAGPTGTVPVIGASSTPSAAASIERGYWQL